MKRVKPEYWKTAFPILGMALLATGCGHQQPAAPPEQILPAADVRLVRVEALSRVATEEVVGTVRPKLSATLSAKVSGTLVQMLAVPGQTVKKGDLLAQIDAKETQARLDQATAVRDQAKKDLDRTEKLLAQNVITQAEMDAVQSRYRVAEATVREGETLLSYTRVLAPFDGLVTAKRADVGDMASPGRALLDIEDPNALRLEADVPEALIDRIHLNDRLPVRVPAAGPDPIQGVVSEIMPAADPASRTFRAKLDLPPARGLRSGLFGRVAVPVAEVKAVRVPAAAVLLRGQMEIAFVAQDGRARMRLVKTGKRLGDEVEVVSGLNVGESLVVDGGARLLDSQPVTERSRQP